MTVFYYLVLPVDAEVVELQKKTSNDQPNWTMYHFVICRHATWEYVMNMKTEQPSRFTDVSFYMTSDGNICAKLVMADGSGFRIIQPYNRNQVCPHQLQKFNLIPEK